MANQPQLLAQGPAESRTGTGSDRQETKNSAADGATSSRLTGEQLVRLAIVALPTGVGVLSIPDQRLLMFEGTSLVVLLVVLMVIAVPIGLGWPVTGRRTSRRH